MNESELVLVQSDILRGPYKEVCTSNSIDSKKLIKVFIRGG